MDDPTRRNMLKVGAAAAAMAAMPRVFAQQAGKGGTGKHAGHSTLDHVARSDHVRRVLPPQRAAGGVIGPMRECPN